MRTGAGPQGLPLVHPRVALETTRKITLLSSILLLKIREVQNTYSLQNKWEKKSHFHIEIFASYYTTCRFSLKKRGGIWWVLIFKQMWSPKTAWAAPTLSVWQRNSPIYFWVLVTPPFNKTGNLSNWGWQRGEKRLKNRIIQSFSHTKYWATTGWWHFLVLALLSLPALTQGGRNSSTLCYKLSQNVFLSVRGQDKVSSITLLLFVPEWHFNICMKHFTQRAEVFKVLDGLNAIFSSRTDRFGGSGRGPFCCCSRMLTLWAVCQFSSQLWDGRARQAGPAPLVPVSPVCCLPGDQIPYFPCTSLCSLGRDSFNTVLQIFWIFSLQ